MEKNATPYGHFESNSPEFTVTDPATPRAFDNFLWNDSIFSNVQQTGVGYSDYQMKGEEGVQLFTGVGRICDFDVFGRDHLMNRLVYVRDQETGDFWNLNWEPVRHDYESYRCTHGLGYTLINSRVNGIDGQMRLFVPPGKDPVELWTLRFENTTSRTRRLAVFAYNQFQFKYKSDFDSYGDMIFRGVVFDEKQNAIVASKHPFYKPHDHLFGVMTSNRPITAYDGSRDAFVGLYHTLASPQAIQRGHCSNTPGSSEATIGAAQFDLELAPGEACAFSLLVGATDHRDNIDPLRERYLPHVDSYFNELHQEKLQLQQQNHISTPDPHFNRMVNSWTKQAALFGATWCRWGWNGYRDIVQHGLGVAAVEPSRTRDILLQALSFQYQSGLALRGWNPIDEKAYSDSALWLVFTLVAYLQETADFDLLQTKVDFYDGGDATVLEHIERALDFLENNKGSHGLCLIKFGDWNDSLTGVGKEGRGESVWLSQACAEALRQMAELLHRLDQADQAEAYERRRAELLAAINRHAWDGNWYTRCFDDEGQALGSRENTYGRMFLEPQSWALISGAADPERAQRLIDACDEVLATPMGYQLLTPSFQEVDERVGRLSSLEPGICENGTIYSHLNIWMILGLLRYGMADKAYEVYRRITPGYFEDDMAQKRQCPPYMYANCYYGPEHRNNRYQMEFTWITGSLAWFNTVPLQAMLGVQAQYDGLVIDPCLPSHWEKCEVTRQFRGADYHITILNPERLQKGRIELRLDGELVEGNQLPLLPPGATSRVTVRLHAQGESQKKQPAAEQPAFNGALAS